ncbi:TadE/TadG family type IV pilus assembly protein [Granulicella aggregans]|jgi:hypothetical protein|uniref:TadE/TadG family type IV pilus assembly protein n=1 Tax=Granulicella aggregans TaxID=474949 RepID=UPI0037C0AD44
MTFTPKFVRRNEGSSLIEVALILPVMILMLIAVVDFGVILHQDLLVADSARSAAEAATTFPWANNLNYTKSVGTSSASGIPDIALMLPNIASAPQVALKSSVRAIPPVARTGSLISTSKSLPLPSFHSFSPSKACRLHIR